VGIGYRRFQGFLPLGAWDKDGNTLYVYLECVVARGSLPLLAQAIRERGSWIDGLFDQTARKRSKPEGQKLIDALLDLRLEILTVPCDAEAAVVEITGLISTKRLKVFSTCTEWIAQFRSYRRNKDGDLVEGSDGLMRATDLLALYGPMIDAPSEGTTDARDADWEAGRDPLTGY